MVTFSSLIVGLSAIAVSLAAPAETSPRDLQKRGPYNFALGPEHPLSRRSNTNYNQDYTTGGSVSFSPETNGFSVNWNTQQDFVVGVGWNPGTTAPITYSGSFSVSSGLGSLSVYGWSTNPLVEYYVMEDTVDLAQTGTVKGTFTSDGGTYTIYTDERVNEPSIEGTSTFPQYISVRNSPRTSGTVTVENHFNAWAAAGLALGTLNFQVIAIESWSGSGSATQSVTNTGGGTTTPPTGGSCAALWDQCGGEAWTGATCCTTGTCKAANSYYSQCLE